MKNGLSRFRFTKTPCFMGLLCLALLAQELHGDSGSAATARRAKLDPAELNQVLRENAVFFAMLTTFSFTAALADDEWGLDLKDINVNLVSREARDAHGRQFVRVRIAGAIRSNHNVEMNLLDEAGSIVGKSFFGYSSGQVTFYDRDSKAIIEGFVDWDGNFELEDLRLQKSDQLFAWGAVEPCFPCGHANYVWYDGLNTRTGGGRVYQSGITDGLRLSWSFESGWLSDVQPAYGEAEYDLMRETTGAINSVLFDGARTAEGFFQNPYGLIGRPPGQAYLPRFTNETGIVVTNPGSRRIPVTYIARRFDASLIVGAGIENPVTYNFEPGRQYTALPGDIFRAATEMTPPSLLDAGEIGWMEIFSDEGDVQVMCLDGNTAGTALDASVGADSGDAPLVFADLRLGDKERTEISLLNLAYDDIMVRLEWLDRDGTALRVEPEVFIAGYGMRNFALGPASDLPGGGVDLARVASLRVSCNNSNSIKSSSCSELVGLAALADRFGSLASTIAATAASAGQTLIGPHFVAGGTAESQWTTVVRIYKFEGDPGPARVDLYDDDGNRITTLEQNLAPGGQAAFTLDAATLSLGESTLTGYIRVRNPVGKVAGDVSLTWSDGSGSILSTYPLANQLTPSYHFDQVAQGRAGEVDYWTGISLVNDLDKNVRIELEVIRPDGTIDRAVTIALEPFQRICALLPELLQDPAYVRLDGYMRVTSSDPIGAAAFFGDSGNRFLAAIPGIPR